MKRIFSLLLVCTMLFSMMTVVHADETLTINYWNADSTKITLDLSQEIDPLELQAGTTLTFGEETIDFTVVQKEKTVNETIEGYTEGKYAVSGMITTNDVTYELIPVGGIVLDELYTITISADVTGAEEWTKTFKVKKLWVEDFNGYTSGDASTIPWKLEGASNVSKFDVEDNGNGDKALVWSYKGGNGRVIIDVASAAEFADTGMASSSYWAANSDARKRTEYNIELDLRFATTASAAKYAKGFKIAMQNLKHNQVLYGGSGIAAGIQVRNEKEYTFVAGTWNHGNYKYNENVDFQTINKNTLKANWHEYFTNGFPFSTEITEWSDSPFKNSDLSDGDWTNDTFHNVNMLVKDNNLKYGLDDYFINYGFDAHAGKSLHQFGVFAFYAEGNYGMDTTYMVDNIIVTKAVEVKLYDMNAPYNVRTDMENIMFDLNSKIEVDSIKNGILLLKNGEIVFDFDVEKEADTNTYAIKPAEGIDTSATYTLTLSKGSYDDVEGNVAVLAEDFTTDTKYVIPVMNEPLYWNADTTKITIDLDVPIAVESLAGGITLFKDGEEVTDYIVSSLNNAATLAKNYTYAIVPEEGIVGGSVYTLEIADAIYQTESGLVYNLVDKYSKTFDLQILVHDKMDYSNDVEVAGDIPWNHGLLSGADNATISIEKVDDNNALKIETTGKAWIAPYEGNKDSIIQNFADTGMSGWNYSYGKSHPAANEENINLEAKVKVITSGNYSLQFYQNDARHTEWKVWMNSLRVQNKKIGARLRNGADSDYASWSANATPGLNSNTYKYVCISSKGTDYKYYAGDAYLHQISDVEMKNVGIPVIYVDNGVTGAANTWYFDDVIISKVREYFEYPYTLIPGDGEIDDVAIGDTIKATFDAEIVPATIIKENVKVYADGEELTGYSVSADENDSKSIIIKLDAPYEYKTEYSVAISNFSFVDDTNIYVFPTYTFTTTVPDVDITSWDMDGVDISALKTGTYNVKANFINNKVADGISGIATICLYSEDGKMIDIETKEFDLAKGKKDNISATWKIEKDGKYFAVCYLWDGFDTMNTIYDDIIE